MILSIDGCDDDILIFTNGSWLFRHEFRGMCEYLTPDELAKMVFIAVSPCHEDYDDFVAAIEAPVCL